MFKFIRLSITTIFFTLAGYYFVQAEDGKKVTKGMKSEKRNIVKKVSYKRKFNGGILLLTANEVIQKTKENLLLSEIRASFDKKGKNVTIESGKCDLRMNEKKAYLRSNVIIKSADATCCTESAVVDFSAHTIYGNSKVTGMNARGSFISNGFSIDKDGVIELKSVEIKGKKK